MNCLLTPDSEPPHRSARWCPACHRWYEQRGARRCLVCGTAVMRPAFRSKPKAGELRPGVVAEFADPRDRIKCGTQLEARQ